MSSRIRLVTALLAVPTSAQIAPLSLPGWGFGVDSDAQLGGMPGSAPFNNPPRRFTDPVGANGGR